jgi:hypothetical protein
LTVKYPFIRGQKGHINQNLLIYEARRIHQKP